MNRLVGLVLIVGTGTLWAQTPTFRSGVNAVRVDVLVTRGDQPVAGLGPEDFEVSDNGVPQHVDFVSFDEIPVNVVLALDMSDSVAGQGLEQLRAAGRDLVAALTPADRVGLVTFGSAVSVPVELTSDAGTVAAAIAAPADAGETTLVDASYTAMTLGNADAGRGLVVIFSDGDDTASFLSSESVLTTAKRMNVTVYGVTAAAAPAAGGFLQDLSELTGGRVLNVPTRESLGTRLVAILSEFRHRYLLSYTPQGVASTGWHRLDVHVNAPQATISARSGYLAGP